MRYRLVDIGNSTVIFSDLLDGQIQNVNSMLTNVWRLSDLSAFVDGYDLIFVSSVVPDIDKRFCEYDHVILIDSLNIPSLTLCMDDPKEIGADRLVTALGAVSEYQRHCLIVDSGTALTFCHVTNDFHYYGGMIFPGMGIASKPLLELISQINQTVLSHK